MRYTFYLLVVLSLVTLSCFTSKNSVDTNQSEVKNIDGLVTATEYNIPLPCTIDVYHKKKNISTTVSNRQGKFTLSLEKKFVDKSLFVCITPLENSITKDTLFYEYYEVVAECMFHNPEKKFVTDTIYFSLKDDSSSLDWNIKGCVAYQNGKEDME
jgi:hypothetical protein